MWQDTKQILILLIAAVAGFIGSLVGIGRADYAVAGPSALILGFCGKLLFDKYRQH